MRLAGSLSAAVAALAALAAGPALAQNGLGDNQAGVPLNQRDAAQTWALEHQGRTLCHLRLGDHRTAGGVFGLEIPADCGGNLPSGVAGWRPTSGGAAFVDAGGHVLIDFNRWSNSLLVASRNSGYDVALRRGV